MWTSVPQIVVVVTLTSASSGPTSRMRLSSSTMRPGSTNTAAFIIVRVGLLGVMDQRRACGGGATWPSTSSVRRRSALPITLTDESAIAAAATTGDSSRPKKG